MTRRAKILRNAAIGLAALIFVVAVAALIMIRTQWFRDFAREQVLSAIQDGTGGRVEMGKFTFDGSRLRARLDNLVIHGAEPPGADPFVRAQSVEVHLRPFGAIKGLIGVSYLGIERPQVNIIVFDDGRTNVPTPKSPSQSKDTPLETVVDLQVGRFDLNDGTLSYNSRVQPLDVRANNLRAQLWFHRLPSSYQGQLSMEPIYVASGRNTPVTFRVTVPVTVKRDGVVVQNATIATPDSTLHIDASLDNLRQPRISAQVRGHAMLADLKNAAGLPLETGRRGVPNAIDLEANAEGSFDNIQVKALKLSFGRSRLEASGALKDARGNGSLRFDGDLSLPELAALAGLNARLQGTASVNGEARLDAANRYQVTGRVATAGLRYEQGKMRLRDAAISTGVRMSPDRLELNGLRLAAFGGEFTGDAAMENFRALQVKGNLRRFDVESALLALTGVKAPYAASLSGSLDANGDLHEARAVDARARLSIQPGRSGIPTTGKIDADYIGRDDDVVVRDSYVALPHTRLTAAGSLRRGLDVSLVTRDARDLTAMSSSAPPVDLASGQAAFRGSVSGRLSSPAIAGHIAASRFRVEGRLFDQLDADVAAAAARASVQHGTLSRGTMRAGFDATVALTRWSPMPASPIAVNATVQNGDLADLLAMAGQPSANSSGALNATLHVGGTIGNPSGSASLAVVDGAVRGEPFQRIDARVVLSDRLASVPSASIVAPAGRADLTAEFQHPPDSFTSGHIHATIRTTPIDLAQVRTLASQSPAGQLQLNADVAGNLSDHSGQAEFLPVDLQADASARGLRFQGQPYGDAQLQARTASQTATVDLTSNFAGSSIRVHGATRLAPGYQTTASAQVSGLAIERVLALAHRPDIPARGRLSLTAQAHGTIQDPQGDATVDLANAVLWNEPLDRLQAQVNYQTQRIDLTRLDAAAGPSHIALSARFDHPAGRLNEGRVEFHVENSQLQLARLKTVQNLRPGLAGAVTLSANGGGEVRAASPPLLLTSLNANVNTANLAEGGKSLGNLALAAHTTSGDRLDFTLKSDLAGSSIQAQGNARLSADYPVDAQLSFRNVAWTRIAPLISAAEGPPSFDVTADGTATVKGPALQPAGLTGSLEIARLEAQPLPEAGARPVVIRNQGPVQVSLNHNTVTLTAFHVTGPQIDVQANGTVPLTGGNMKIAVNGHADLAVLKNFSPELTSSGSIVLNANVVGTPSNPDATGRLELHNATVNSTAFTNGISNANGVVVLRGTRAQAQNITAETGGGKVTINGNASYAGLFRFALTAKAQGVRIRVQEGVSINVDADLRVAGTPSAGTLTGSVTIGELTYAPRTDLASILTRSGPPVESAASPSAFAQNMKLDVRVRTSPAMRIQASLADNLQTDADLRVRGSLDQPSVLGQVNLTEGKLSFFGSSYTINTGTISFYNPVRIEPILNLSLETQTQGVDVVLTVSGPVDNMKLTYTSDPPLRFDEIVALISAGKTPTSDPTLLANQPTPPQQSYQQMGESAIVSQAIANPVSERLQRVFGVNQLKIDPTFAGASQLPTAQVTLQQQITQKLTFTYVSQIDDPNSTLVRADWSLNPRWSAQATRDQNGIVSVSLLYKRKFH